MNPIRNYPVTVLAAAVTGLVLSSASAGVVFSESFESPVVNGYANNTLPSGGKWIGSSGTFGATNRGLYNETFAWPATVAFTTPYGAQAYYLNYGGTGLTTAVGATGQTLTAGVTYKLSFNAAVAAGTTSGTYLVELVAFAAANDDTARANVQSSRPGTVLGSVTGTVTATDMATAPSIIFTPLAGNAHLGKDLGIRILKATNSVLYDNLRLVAGHDMNPSPASGVTVASGTVPLSWTNMPPSSGTNIHVDVWFGTNPAALTKQVDGALNTSSTNVTAPVAGTYYWRVDSYLDGSPTGTPVTGDLFSFVVTDTDTDGFPDTYELANTTPPSNTGLNPGDNPDNDGLTNLQEYQYGTQPNHPDSDGDSLFDGPEINGTAGARPATNPLRLDSDGDGLSDGIETNTGIWAGPANTGTNPMDADWDNDGLKDGVEKRTGTFVSRTTDTGTDPYLVDTDSDGAGDWYEVAATFTSPNSNAEQSPIPYPLPDPDGSTGAADKPVKVYIMSGQSNMVGIGYVNGTNPGTLETIAKRENKFPNLVGAGNAWTTRNDVIYKGVVTAIAAGPLTAGQGAGSDQLGPELGFGHIMGWYHDEPVLILKASQGNRSLGWDFYPPGGGRFNWAGSTHAAYGEAPLKWITGGPAPTGWYAGKQYDDCFRSEQTMGPLQTWTSGTIYPNGCMLRHNGVLYIAKNRPTPNPDATPPVLPYVDSPLSEPGIGGQAATYWDLYSIVNAYDVLKNGILQNLPTTGNNLNGRSYEIAGFVWWQGHKDQYEAGHYNNYEANLAQLVDSLRADFNAPNAPFVVGTIGFDGGSYAPGTPYDHIYKAQKAISDPAKHPDLAGTVASVDTTGYWRTLAESPGSQGFHYNNSAETYMLVGDALGRAMLDLLEDNDPPSPDPLTFTIAPTPVNATTVGMTATAAVDVSGPVEYYFENTGNGNSRTWSTDRSWNNSGLTTGVNYNFRVKARDGKGTETGWSAELGATPGNDVTAPMPNPMSFATAPTELGENSITMTASTALDVNGVEYFFDCLTVGGHDSAWQDGPTYVDTGLSPSTQYTYQVRARDKSTGQNLTAFSGSASATTVAPDSTPPSPNPMTFATPPTAQGESSITMVAATASDVSGVEYFFDCLTPGGHDSGWQGSPNYTDSGLNPATEYAYQVTARDKSPALNSATPSAPAAATTEAPDLTPPSVLSLSPADNAIDVPVAANLVVTFDEEVIADSGSIIIKNLSDSIQTVIDINDASRVTISGAVLTINPAVNLSPGKNHAVQIAATAIQDTAGNPFSGITIDTGWNFTSAVVPHVWTQTAGNAQDWTIGTNWLAGTAPDPIAGDTVDFSSVNLAANTTLTLGADRSAQLWKFGDTSGTQTWTVNSGHKIVLAGTTPAIQVNNATTTLNNVVDGAAGLVKTGGGTLVLANTANTYSGGTTVNAGTLNITGNGSLGGGTVTFAGSSTLAGTGSLTLNRGFTLNSGTSIIWSLTNTTVSGPLSGGGTLNCPTGDASGTTSFLSTANDFTGQILMGSGIFRSIVVVNSLGDSPGAGQIRLGSTTSYGLGNLTLGTGAIVPLTFNHRRIDIASPGGSANLVNDNTANSHANIITVNTDLLSTPAGSKTLVLSGANTGNNLIAGKIVDGNGTVNLTKSGAGKWVVSAASSFSGKTTVNQGTLAFSSIGTVNGGPSTLGNPGNAANGTILIGSAGNTGTLLYTGSATSTDRSIQINSATNTNTGGATIQNNGGGPLAFTATTFNTPYTLASTVTRTLTLSGSNGGTIGGVIQDNSATGKVALTKSGGGTWTLAGPNSYTGATTVSGGKLFINGDQSTASGAVGVSANATLGGTGVIGGTTTVAAGGKLEFKPGTSTANHDKLELAAGKALLFTGASTLTLTSGGVTSPGDYTLVTAPGGFGSSVAPATVVLPQDWVADPPRFVGNDLKINIRITGITATPFETWSGGAAAEVDTNGDGVKNAVAWVIGATGPSANATGLLPTLDITTDPDFFIFTYRRDDDAVADANTTIKAQYAGTPAGWTEAVPGPDIIITPDDDGAGIGVDLVEVKIRRTLQVNGKLFVRLNVVVTP